MHKQAKKSNSPGVLPFWKKHLGLFWPVFIVGSVAVLAGFIILYEAQMQAVENDLLSIQWINHARAAELFPVQQPSGATGEHGAQVPDTQPLSRIHRNNR